jgi:short subunit dehydrogenase-like uncharacterized protein
MEARSYDLVLFGATGFTGGLVAQYLSGHAAAETRWAVAGRSIAKLESVTASLAGTSCPPAGLVLADVSDRASLAALAQSARVLITTVGPYERHGLPVVEACVDARTHYVDITGEPHFVSRAVERFHQAAKAAEVAVVPCCGFDSIPPDLGVYYTAGLLPSDAPMSIRGYLAVKGGFSGGTWHSAIGILKDQPLFRKRSRRSVDGDARKVRALELGFHRESKLGFFGLPLPTIDPWIIRRSARALDRYGPDFRYGHYFRTRSLPKAMMLTTGAASLGLLAKLPPARALLLRVKDPGEGPSEDARADGYFSIIFVGEGGERTVVTEVKGGDPGYTETAKMLSESALCLAFDSARPSRFGVLTPAVAMGDALLSRLQARQIEFTTRD